MTKEEMIGQLKIEMILNYGSWGAFAKSLGISQTLMSMMISGSRGLNKAVLDHMGMEKEVVYVPIKP